MKYQLLFNKPYRRIKEAEIIDGIVCYSRIPWRYIGDTPIEYKHFIQIDLYIIKLRLTWFKKYAYTQPT